MSMYSADQRCPRCQYPNVPGAQTCVNCGLALTSAPQSSPYGAPQSSPYGAEPQLPPPPTYSSPSTPSTPYGPPPTGPYGGNSNYGGGTSYDFTPQPPPPPSPYGGAPTYYPGGTQPAPPFGGSAPAYPGSQPQYPGSQPQPGFPVPGISQPPVQKRTGSGTRIAIIALVVLVILGGVGAAAWLLTRPKPVVSVTSDYKVGSTPAGATSTVLHVTGQKFSGSSNVTFLLDDQIAPDSQPTLSDSNGNIKADLKVTDNWGVGQHVLKAKDAGNYTTQQGITISIVSPGDAKTP